MNTISGIVKGAIAKNVFCLLLPVLVLVCVYASPGGDEFLEKKDFRQWSKKECQNLLEDSPWSKRYVMTSEPAVIDLSPKGIAATERSITYSVQLRSAMPIRKAIVRQIQIKQKNANLSIKQKQHFENTVRDLLSASPPDEVIVHVAVSSNATDLADFADHELALYWLTKTTDQLKSSVYLIGEKGFKVSVERFVPEKDFSQLQLEMLRNRDVGVFRKSIEFEFIFPRRVEGREILTAGDKSLKLEFLHPIVGKMSEATKTRAGFIEFRRCSIEFNADKMKIQGKFVY